MTAVELCAGIGGLSLGLMQAGFRMEAMIEADDQCVDDQCVELYKS